MLDDIKRADENLAKFLEKYGTDGILKLFYSNYLYNLVTYYLQTKGNTKEDDPGYLYYFNFKGKPFSQEQIDNFNKKLQKICQDHASKVIEFLKTQHDLETFVSEPFNPQSQILLQSAFEKIIKKFGEE